MSGLSAAAFGPSILAARTEAGLTQKQVGALAGVTQMTVSHVERGRDRPRLDTAIALCEALKLPSLDEACTPKDGGS